jgi:transcription elongation factor Elf1
MTFNTGYLCNNCGSRRVYASLLGRGWLHVVLNCGNCGSMEDHEVALIGDHFDYRKRGEVNG